MDGNDYLGDGRSFYTAYGLRQDSEHDPGENGEMKKQLKKASDWICRDDVQRAAKLLLAVCVACLMICYASGCTTITRKPACVASSQGIAMSELQGLTTSTLSTWNGQHQHGKVKDADTTFWNNKINRMVSIHEIAISSCMNDLLVATGPITRRPDFNFNWSWMPLVFVFLAAWATLIVILLGRNR
jgi:hypothetical protein